MPGGFAQVRDVAVAPDGTVWAADTWNNRFQRFAPDGTFQATFGRRNSHPPYGMDYPRGIAVNPANGEVWVSSTRDHFIRVYDASGTTYLRTVGNGADSTAAGSFRWPMDVEFAGANAWVADYTSCKLKKVDAATGAELLERLRVQQRHRDRSDDRQRLRRELAIRPRVRLLPERRLPAHVGERRDRAPGSSRTPGTSTS